MAELSIKPAATALLLACATGAALAQPAKPPISQVRVDQIATGQSAAATATVGVGQLPHGLAAQGNGGEDALANRTGPPRTLTDEVIATWNLIRNRGQTPTPDLIAHEIGPDKLAEFLAGTPGAASILATGTLPDPQPASSPEGSPAAAKPVTSPGSN